MKTLGLILLAIFTIVSWEIGPTIMPPAWEWYSNCWNQKQPDGIAVIVQLCSIFYGFFGFTVSFLFSYICIKDKNSVFGLVKECINELPKG